MPGRAGACKVGVNMSFMKVANWVMEAEQVGQSVFVLHVVEVKVFIASDSNLICTKRKTKE